MSFRSLEVSDPRFSHEGLHQITVKPLNLLGKTIEQTLLFFGRLW